MSVPEAPADVQAKPLTPKISISAASPLDAQGDLCKHTPIQSRGAPMPVDQDRQPLPQGSLDLLILRTLVAGAKHGYAIARHLRVVSEEFIRVEEGSLYPALHRLEKRGWVSSCWGASESNRRAKFYDLTRAGKKQLTAETTAWRNMHEAILRVLNHPVTENGS